MLSHRSRLLSNKENSPSASSLPFALTPCSSTTNSATPTTATSTSTPNKPRVKGIGRAPKSYRSGVPRYASQSKKPYHRLGGKKTSAKAQKIRRARVAGAGESRAGAKARNGDAPRQGGPSRWFKWAQVPKRLPVPDIEPVSAECLQGIEGLTPDLVAPTFRKSHHLALLYHPIPQLDHLRPNPSIPADEFQRSYPSYDPLQPPTDTRFSAWGIPALVTASARGKFEPREVDEKTDRCGFAPDSVVWVWKKGHAEGMEPVSKIPTWSPVLASQCSNWPALARTVPSVPKLHRPGTRGGRLGPYDAEREAREVKEAEAEYDRPWSPSDDEEQKQDQETEQAEVEEEEGRQGGDTSFDSNATLRPNSPSSKESAHGVNVGEPGDWEFKYDATSLPSVRRLCNIHLCLPHPEAYYPLHQHLHDMPNFPLFRWLLHLPASISADRWSAQKYMKDKCEWRTVEWCMVRIGHVRENAVELGVGGERTWREIGEAWRACTGVFEEWHLEGGRARWQGNVKEGAEASKE